MHHTIDAIYVYMYIILCIIVISEFLEHHSKAKSTRTSDYSRALRQIKLVVQRIVCGKLRSGFQRVRGNRVAVKVGVV